MAHIVEVKGFGELSFPDSMTPEQIQQAVERFSKSATFLRATKPQEYDHTTQPFQNRYGPTSGMTTGQKFGAGYGKAAVDLGRGVGQLAGAVSREDIQAARELDAPLMATGAGRLGNFSGAVANAAPAAFIPGANTVGGAAVVGAGLGLLQPSTSTRETLTNVGLGGGLGGGSVAAVRGGVSLYRGGKALIEPFTHGGQERIASRTLQAFAGGEGPSRQAAQNIDDALLGHGLGIKPILEGVEPTTAELARNPGLAQLERTIRNNPEYVTHMTDRTMANKDAMMGALDSIAGSPGQMAAAKGARSSATNQLYESAGRQTVSADDTFAGLLRRPSMQKAWDVAADLAAENGDQIAPLKELLEQGINPASMNLDGKLLHYLKMAMDDLADSPQVHGIGGNQVRSINATKAELVKWIGAKIPDYDQARTTYSAMSRPVNQMEVGGAFRDKLQPALADFGASSRTRGAAYAEALRNGDDFAAQTLGRSTARLSDIMEPEQTAKLRMIAEQLGRRANADELGRAVGSNTGQNIVSQNVLRQILGPLGLPESTIQRAAESTLLQSVMRPVQFAGQLGEQRVMQHLARAALDPKVSSELLKVGIDPKSIGFMLRNQQYLAPAVVSGTDAARQ